MKNSANCCFLLQLPLSEANWKRELNCNSLLDPINLQFLLNFACRSEGCLVFFCFSRSSEVLLVDGIQSGLFIRPEEKVLVHCEAASSPASASSGSPSGASSGSSSAAFFARFGAGVSGAQRAN